MLTVSRINSVKNGAIFYESAQEHGRRKSELTRGRSIRLKLCQFVGDSAKRIYRRNDVLKLVSENIRIGTFKIALNIRIRSLQKHLEPLSSCD